MNPEETITGLECSVNLCVNAKMDTKVECSCLEVGLRAMRCPIAMSTGSDNRADEYACTLK
jgi:hypothetical protein